jgi:hypothetical protein
MAWALADPGVIVEITDHANLVDRFSLRASWEIHYDANPLVGFEGVDTTTKISLVYRVPVALTRVPWRFAATSSNDRYRRDRAAQPSSLQ